MPLAPIIMAIFRLVSFGAVGALTVVLVRNNSQRAKLNMSQHPGPPPIPAPASDTPQDTAMWWYARVGPLTRLNTLSHGLSARLGVLHLSAGALSFTRPDQTEPDWQVPVRQISLKRVLGGIGLVPGVRMESPGTGAICVGVSREPMTIWDENSLAELRQVKYSDEFVRWLLDEGARPLP